MQHHGTKSNILTTTAGSLLTSTTTNNNTPSSSSLSPSSRNHLLEDSSDYANNPTTPDTSSLGLTSTSALTTNLFDKQHQTAEPFSRNNPAQWYYKDPSGVHQGPFSPEDMQAWYSQNYFSPDLPIKKSDQPSFQPLKSLLQKFGTEAPFLEDSYMLQSTDSVDSPGAGITSPTAASGNGFISDVYSSNSSKPSAPGRTWSENQSFGGGSYAANTTFGQIRAGGGFGRGFGRGWGSHSVDSVDPIFGGNIARSYAPLSPAATANPGYFAQPGYGALPSYPIHQGVSFGQNPQPGTAFHNEIPTSIVDPLNPQQSSRVVQQDLNTAGWGHPDQQTKPSYDSPSTSYKAPSESWQHAGGKVTSRSPSPRHNLPSPTSNEGPKPQGSLGARSPSPFKNTNRSPSPQPLPVYTTENLQQQEKVYPASSPEKTSPKKSKKKGKKAPIVPVDHTLPDPKSDTNLRDIMNEQETAVQEQQRKEEYMQPTAQQPKTWATAEAPRMTFAEIQQTEARAAKQKEQERAERVQRALVAETQKLQLEEQSVVPSSAVWGASNVARPETGKGQKTIAQIMHEEESRKKSKRNVAMSNAEFAEASLGMSVDAEAARVATAAGGWSKVTAGRAAAVPQNFSHPKSVKPRSVHGNDGGWNVVGASPAASTSQQQVRKPIAAISSPASATSSKTSSIGVAKPMTAQQQQQAADPALVWARSALKAIPSQSGAFNPNAFIDMLMSIDYNGNSQMIHMICDDTLGGYTSIDSRKFADEFIKRRRGGWTEVAKGEGAIVNNKKDSLRGFESANKFVTVKSKKKR